MNYKKYREELKNVLMTGDLHKFREFFEKHKKYIGRKTTPSDDMLEVTMHKVIISDMSLPKEIRDKSKRWLIEKGFSPLVYGNTID